LLRLGIVEDVIPEPLGGAHRNPQEVAVNLKAAILKHLLPLLKLSPVKLTQQRYDRFRRFGQWLEN
jgi:acetyl-CoA carboxylase alpha subunit